MTHIFLIRHGESEGNAARILCGQTIPTSLTSRGRSQILEAGRGLKDLPFEAVYSSPITRAVQSAEILSNVLGLGIVPDERFIETDVGSLAGRNLDQIYLEDKDWAQEFYTETYVKYGVEKFSKIVNRVREGILDISNRHPEGNVIVVTHLHPIKSALVLTLKLEPAAVRNLRVSNGSISVLRVDNGEARLLAFNVLNPSRYLDSD